MAGTLQNLMRKTAAPKGWAGYLDAVRAVAKGSHEAHKALLDMGSVPIQKASTQAESSGIVGGYTVPIDFNMSIATSYEENSFWYPRATVVPMFSRQTDLPRMNAETVQTSGVPNWWGGMTFTWGTQRTGLIIQTNPTLSSNTLTAQNLIGTIIVSQDLNQDIGAGGDEFLFNMFARGSAWNEEWAFFNGLGGSQNQPLGVLQSASFVSVNRAQTGQIGQADIDNLAGSMTPLGWTKAIWVCSPSAFKQVSSTTGFIANQSALDTLGISAAGSLMGRPLFISDKVPALGTTGDLGFYDPTQYLIGERLELVVQVSDQAPSVFLNNQVIYKVWRRLDGQPIFSKPVTLQNGDVVSSFAVLHS
jgi:HK97 family phage major capsid protein